MKCWHCDEELIWGNDDTIEDEGGNNLLYTNLSCSGCEAFVQVYLPIADTDKLNKGG